MSSSWDQFCTSLKKGAGRAADKINQSADLATLQVKLSMAEYKLQNAYALLGQASYRHFSEESSHIEAIEAAMKAVELEQKKVNTLKSQIAKMKNV